MTDDATPGLRQAGEQLARAITEGAGRETFAEIIQVGAGLEVGRMLEADPALAADERRLFAAHRLAQAQLMRAAVEHLAEGCPVMAADGLTADAVRAWDAEAELARAGLRRKQFHPHIVGGRDDQVPAADSEDGS